jgi:hypothetical protein
MSIYQAYIVGLHGRSIGVVRIDCADDDSAIKSASRLVDDHDVELWQMDRPIARFDAPSKQVTRVGRPAATCPTGLDPTRPPVSRARS